MNLPTKPSESLDHFLSAIRAEVYEQQKKRAALKGPPVPFVTISRQAGAGGRTLAALLVERLGAAEPRGGAWTAWDRELVEKVSRERSISASLIETLEGRGRNWFQQLFADVTDADVYRYVIGAMRVLARAGRAVIVGRGGVYATAELPAGVHVRLVAPFKDRVAREAKNLNVSEDEAAKVVKRIQQERDAFYRTHWPGRHLTPDVFTIVLNTGSISDVAAADCIVRLVQDMRERAATMPRTPVYATA